MIKMATTRNVFFPVLLLLLLIGIGVGVGIYFFIYKRHINKTLRESLDDPASDPTAEDTSREGFGENPRARERHPRRMPALPSIVSTICAVVLLICVIFSAFKIQGLYEEMNGRMNNLSNQISNLQNNLFSLYDELEEEIREANSLIAFSDYTVGDFDPESRRAEVSYKVIPKESSTGALLTLRIGEEFLTLTESSAGVYEGSAEFDIFETYDSSPVLTIEQNGQKQTEILDELYFDELWRDFLPQIDASLDLIPEEKDFLLQGNVYAYYDRIALVSLRMTVYLDGKLLTEKDLFPRDGKADADKGFENWIDERFTAPSANALTVVIEGTDSLGYSYRSEISFAGLNNEDMDMMISDDQSSKIFDKNGTLLYGPGC